MRFKFLTFIFLFLISAFPAFALSDIDDCTDLENMANNRSEDYQLTTDIDCDGVDFDPIGPSSLNKFTGSLDGQGYTISNLTINKVGTNYASLLGYTDGAVVSDLIIESASVTGQDYVGVLGGWFEDGSITNVGIISSSINGRSLVGGLGGFLYNADGSRIYVSGGTVTSSGSSVGGIAGRINQGNYSDLYSSIDVSADDHYVGGIAGYWLGDLEDGIISNAYASGDIEGTNQVGGLFGIMSDPDDEFGDGSIILGNSFSTANVTANGVNSGGITGFFDAGQLISNSYWNDTDNSPDNCYPGGNTGCTAIEDNISYFYNPDNAPLSSWNFSTIWHEISSALPQLAWTFDSTITDVSPASGTENGGTTITITGTGLTGASAVSLRDSDGDTTSCSITSNNATTITCSSSTRPTAVALNEALDVLVTIGSNTFIDYSEFTYLDTAPVISDVSISQPTTTTATITWSTDEAASTSATYGINNVAENQISKSESLSNHSITLTGLSTCETYQYYVSSTDSTSNTSNSSTSSFSTGGCGGGGGGGGSAGFKRSSLITEKTETQPIEETENGTEEENLPTCNYLDLQAHWAKLAAKALCEKQIIRDSNYFYPNKKATRAEVLKIAFKLANIEFSEATEGEWHQNLIKLAQEKGIINENRANDFITRAETLKIFTETLNIDLGKTEQPDYFFHDVLENDWHYAYILHGKNQGWISGYTDNSFRPNQNISRAEIAAIANKLNP